MNEYCFHVQFVTLQNFWGTIMKSLAQCSELDVAVCCCLIEFIMKGAFIRVGMIFF